MSSDSKDLLFNLSFGLSFLDLYSHEGLSRLDDLFRHDLFHQNAGLCEELDYRRLEQRDRNLSISHFCMSLAPYVESFIIKLFQIQTCVDQKLYDHEDVRKMLQVQRQFVQRFALKKYPQSEYVDISPILGLNWTEQDFINVVLNLQDMPNEHIESLARYASWASTTAEGKAKHQESVLFLARKPFNPDNILNPFEDGDIYQSDHFLERNGFNLKDLGLTFHQSCDQAQYCIVCHPQGKDSCRKGFLEEGLFKEGWSGMKLSGCPLDQKISEMNALKQKGMLVAALAMAMVDNPLLPATGHRICNDCMRSCIFQKQDPVNVPGIETQLLNDVLDLPWGVEIYSLLSRWNPLNVQNPYIAPPTGRKIMIAGQGPAGFALAYYLLRDGHQVFAIDGAKIEPFKVPFQPIKCWKDLCFDLENRPQDGFGGVMEFGITSRWNKNYLTLIRLLLGRYNTFYITGGTRLGGTLHISQALEAGFDHVALCLGAGKPATLSLPRSSLKGVRYANDFLMSIHLLRAYDMASLAHFPIRFPVIVIGAGLTAMDTATEVGTYYFKQLEKFKHFWAQKSKTIVLSDEEQEIADAFLDHLQDIENSDLSNVELLRKWGGVTVISRGPLQQSAAFRTNHEELIATLQEGVLMVDHAKPSAFEKDQFGWVDQLIVETKKGRQSIPAKTVLIATGLISNASLENDDLIYKQIKDNIHSLNSNTFIIDDSKVSVWGDLHPSYRGSVVKALASAKNGYQSVSTAIGIQPSNNLLSLSHFAESLLPRVLHVRYLNSDIVQFRVQAPWQARNYKPGHIFRCQINSLDGALHTEPLPLSPIHVDKQLGTIDFVIFKKGGTTKKLADDIKETGHLYLMGPTGNSVILTEPTLMIGEGLYALLFGPFLGQNHQIIGIEKPFMVDLGANKIHPSIDWIDSMENLSQRLQSFFQRKFEHILLKGSWSFIDQIKNHLLPYPFKSITATIMTPMQCMMKGICGQCVVSNQSGESIFCCAMPDWALENIHLDTIHLRSKQNTLMEKLMDIG